MSNCGSETSKIHHMWLKIQFLVHQGIVRFLFLYIDFQEEMFLKEMCTSESQVFQ